MKQRLGRNNNSISLLEKKVINGLRTEQHQQETNKDFSLESRAETGMQLLASTLPTLVNLNFFYFKYLDIAFCSQGSRLQKRLVVIHTSSVHVHSWFITQNYSSLQFPLFLYSSFIMETTNGISFHVPIPTLDEGAETKSERR